MARNFPDQMGAGQISAAAECETDAPANFLCLQIKILRWEVGGGRKQLVRWRGHPALMSQSIYLCFNKAQCDGEAVVCHHCLGQLDRGG